MANNTKSLHNGNKEYGNNAVNPTVKSEYVAKDREKICIDFNGRNMEIRRVWDSKKHELNATLHSIKVSNKSGLEKSLEIVEACLKAVGLEWAAGAPKEVGSVTWIEDGEEWVGAEHTIKYLRNGGQVRLRRHTDGSREVEMDLVTKLTVETIIADAAAWTAEDQAALVEYQRVRKLRKEAAIKHKEFEAKNICTFTLAGAFTSVGM